MSAQDNLNEYQFPHKELKGGYRQVTAMQGQYEVGWIRMKPSGEINALGVAAEHQHKGIATRMYHEAQTYGPVIHSDTRTPAGDSFAKKVGGPSIPLREKGLMAPMEPPPAKWVRP